MSVEKQGPVRPQAVFGGTNRSAAAARTGGGYMFKTLLQKRRDQTGVTGLETAIILIAFVIVASVFAYVVLSAAGLRQFFLREYLKLELTF